MSSRGKKKTTMAKLARESRIRERRVEKKARKDARRQSPGVEVAYPADMQTAYPADMQTADPEETQTVDPGETQSVREGSQA